MKEYSKSNPVVRWLLGVGCIVGTLSLYFDEWFPWSNGLFEIMCAVVLPIVVFSPLKWYCGIVSLRVTDKTIDRVWMLWRTCSIPRESVHICARCRFGMYLWVIAANDFSKRKTIDIVKAVLQRKAIVFPYDARIRSDFPEWFS